MPDDPPPPNLAPETKPPFKWLILAALLVALLAVAYYFYQGGYTLDLGPLKFGTSPTLTAIPTPIPTSSGSIDNCQMTKETDPILEMVGKDGGKTVGIFRGNINKLNTKGGVIELQLIDPKGNQIQDFNIQDRESLFYDTKQQAYIKSSEIGVGNTLFMSFECDPSTEDNQLRFTRIAVTGKIF